LPNLALMNSIGLDTIAGSKLLQLKFGSASAFQPDQAVMHKGRRARFIRVRNGAAIIQHWGGSHALAVPLDTLSVPPQKQRYPAQRATAGADARQAGTSPNRSPLVVRAEVGWLSRHPPQRRPLLRP
jgi:hypothetical protein